MKCNDWRVVVENSKSETELEGNVEELFLNIENVQVLNYSLVAVRVVRTGGWINSCGKKKHKIIHIPKI